MLEKADHLQLKKPFEEWLRDLLHKPCFDCVPLDAEIIAESRAYSFNNDVFDAAITATTKLRDVPLSTIDATITSSGVREIGW